LSYNELKGLIPPEIGNLKKIEKLHLQVNGLSGYAPEFSVDLDDFITDCGKDEEDKVNCPSCTYCCNDEEKCLKMSEAWPKQWLRDQNKGGAAWMYIFSFFGLFIVMVVIFLFVRTHPESKLPFLVRRTYQEESVYKFFLSSSVPAWFIAIFAALSQLVIVYFFINAADVQGENNDWVFMYSCPEDDLSCKKVQGKTLMSWAVFNIIIFTYVGNDALDGLFLIYESLFVNDEKGIVAGAVLVYLTVTTVITSIIYNSAIGTSDTDILQNAVLLLFLNDLDEKLYSIIVRVNPKWIHTINDNISSNSKVVYNIPTEEELNNRKFDTMQQEIDLLRNEVNQFKQSQFFTSMKHKHDLNQVRNDLLASKDEEENSKISSVTHQIQPIRNDVSYDINRPSNLDQTKNLMRARDGTIIDINEIIREIELNRMLSTNDSKNKHYPKRENDSFQDTQTRPNDLSRLACHPSLMKYFNDFDDTAYHFNV